MSATAQLALDVRGFLAGVDMAKQGLNSLRSESVKLDEGSGMARLQMAAIALAAGVTALGIAMYKGVVSTVELGARLVEVSYKSGLAVEEIMALERSLDEVGGKAQDAAPATDKFNAAIQQAANNAGPLAGILNEAGISMQQLAGMSVAERMTAVGDAIRAIKNPAQQSEAAMATFGASGIKMLAALDPKNLNSASSAMGAQAQIMQANAGVFARIMQLMGAQGSSLNSLAVAVFRGGSNGAENNGSQRNGRHEPCGIHSRFLSGSRTAGGACGVAGENGPSWSGRTAWCRRCRDWRGNHERRRNQLFARGANSCHL